MTKQCTKCGKEFSGPQSWMIYRKHCSRQCKSNLVTKLCRRCGKPFTLPASHIIHMVHCSKECQMRRQSVICATCGIIFNKRDCVVKTHNFCSNKCRLEWFSKNFTGDSSPHWQGGSDNYRGPNWKRQKRNALVRDGHTCRHCGITAQPLGQEPDVAHIIPFRNFGIENYREANRLDNLISLCRPCHIVFDYGRATRT